MTARTAIGIDLGGTNIRAALVDLDAEDPTPKDPNSQPSLSPSGRILAEDKQAVSDRSPEAVAEQMTAMVASLNRRGTHSVLGVGVGLAAMLRGSSGVVINAPNLGWREVDFRALLRRRLGPHVELYNDLNAITFGEVTCGAARGIRDVLCVFLGTGLGSGLVLDGKLYTGSTHLAGEIGHTKVIPGGRLCGCGAKGCVEAYVSGVNLAQRAQEELGANREASSLVLALAGGNLGEVHAGHLDEAARQGDAYASRLWDEATSLYALALANAVTLLNPSHLVLGGGVWEKTPEFRRRVLAAFPNLVNAPSAEGLTIVDAELGDMAGVIGAASLATTG